jgi:IS30 family transposase
MTKLPNLLKQSLAWDRGTEMAAHQKFSVATNMDVYFCDPCSPWQRGTNENTNGLLRQYFPRGSCLSGYSQAELEQVAEHLNSRPKKPWDSKRQLISWAKCCSDRLNPSCSKVEFSRPDI